MSKKLVTPEQELIAAVIGALQLGRPLPESVDAILTTPAVQAALAKVRGEGAKAYSKELDRKWDEAILGAEPVAATPKSEPVLRWEERDWRHYCYLGEVSVGDVHTNASYSVWRCDLTDTSGTAPTLTEARTAAEQAVRDWLARAGVV